MCERECIREIENLLYEAIEAASADVTRFVGKAGGEREIVCERVRENVLYLAT